MKYLLLTCTVFFSVSAFAQNAQYPKNTREAFLESCVGGAKELIPFCTCILNAFEKRMPYEDYAKMVQNGTNLARDKRVTTFANYCIDVHKTRR